MNRKLLFLTLLLTLGAEPAAAADKPPAPGEDFFAFANDQWLKASPIPEGKERWNARTEIDALARDQIARLFDDPPPAPGSFARKVTDFHAAYLNEVAIGVRGLAPIQPFLAKIDEIRDKAALTRLMGSRLRADVDPLIWGVYNSSHLLGLAVEPAQQGERRHIAYLLQGGLGLPDREDYLSDAPEKHALRATYLEYIARMLALAGFDRARQRSEAVIALETAIARTHADANASASELNASNLWTRADFARDAPGIDWAEFFAAAGLGSQQLFVVWQPSAIKGAAALMASTPIESWKDYLRFHLIDTQADVLPRGFAEICATMKPDLPPRPARALTAVKTSLGEALGRMYVEKYFPPQYKARLEAITANVIAAFRQRVEAVAWLSAPAKQQALAKLDALYVGLGYPEKWRDYSDLVIDPQDAFGNQLRVADWQYRQTLARLDQPVNLREWRMNAQHVGAALFFDKNSYLFAAGLLQPPKFDPKGSDAETYGAIGAVLGHDITHFVDSLGADNLADGVKKRWWTDADLSNYQKVTEPLVAQYSSYLPLPGAAVDGKMTLVENLADLGGLTAAFDAHRNALGAKASDPGFVRQQDRQFFIAFARAWRGKVRDDALRKELRTDSHAPEEFRVATVRNLDAWYEAFDVRPGQRLYLSPAARVHIW